jgi:hypothetical protein
MFDDIPQVEYPDSLVLLDAGETGTYIGGPFAIIIHPPEGGPGHDEETRPPVPHLIKRADGFTVIGRPAPVLTLTLQESDRLTAQGLGSDKIPLVDENETLFLRNQGLNVSCKTAYVSLPPSDPVFLV